MTRTLLSTLLLLAATAGAGWLGWRLGRRAGATAGDDGGHAAPRRPQALDEAWRAFASDRGEDVQSALARLMSDPPEDPGAAEELAFLLAARGADVGALRGLAEGRRARVPAVIAAAQRVLALAHPDPAQRPAWAERFARAFPRSWALRAPGLGRR